MTRCFAILVTAAALSGSVFAHDWNGIAVDKKGNVYVIDAEDGQIWRIRPGGEVEVFVSGKAGVSMNHPHHLALDENGRLWLSSG